MFEAIDGTSFHTEWRCKFQNQLLRSNARSTLMKNIKLLKDSPEKVGGNSETAKELIELLEGVTDDQAWITAKAMAGLSIDKAIETLTSLRRSNV